MAGPVAYDARRAPPAGVRGTIAEIFVQVLVVGLVFGRFGCTPVHDYIGEPTEFWLAIRETRCSTHHRPVVERRFDPCLMRR